MKLLYIITGLGKGGAEKQLYNLITHLPKTYSIQVVSLFGGEYATALQKKKIQTTVLDISPFRFMKITRQLKKIIEKEQPDIVHSYLPHANILCKIVKKISSHSFKLVCSIRGKTSSFAQTFLEYMTIGCDIAITNSHTLKKYAKNKLGYSTVNVIDNGYLFSSEEKIPLFYKGKKVIITVANFTKEKDYHTNINTVKLVVKAHPNTLFLYVGTGTTIKEQIRKRITKERLSKHIQLLGSRKDVPQLLTSSHIFFLPTISEGQSNSIIEALHYGCPVVTTSISANKELITHNYNGLLAEVHQPKQLAKQLIILLENNALRSTLISQGKKTAKKYTMKENITQHIEVYETLR